ncbi:MAG: heme-binding domain-containing protein [Filimonas sp.]|nr:heme-binding domain-containing protein [Filimonas sp.]
MKARIHKIAIILLLFFLALQFYQPAQNKSKGGMSANDITRLYPAPPEVRQILETSCYDCHSNNTNYAWYDYIQPARLFVEDHIKNGKSELNFNEWGSYSDRKQTRLLKSIQSQLLSGKMPLPSYTWLHKKARLNETEIWSVISWLNKYPQGLIEKNK